MENIFLSPQYMQNLWRFSAKRQRHSGCSSQLPMQLIWRPTTNCYMSRYQLCWVELSGSHAITWSKVMLHHWGYRYISGILLDHLIIRIWILDLAAWIMTWISVLYLPSRLVHQLFTSPLPDLCINRSTTAIRPRANKMWIMFRSRMVVGPQLSMVILYRQETFFLVTELMTIYSCSNGSFLERWGVVNIRALTHLEIRRVIEKISVEPITDVSEFCQPNGLIQINPYFDHTFLVWANRPWDSYVLSGVG